MKLPLVSTALVLTIAAAFAAPNAYAAIISNPASIVDHGSYITDTVNQLDWYKFSNAQTTVGLSYQAAQAQFVPLGWKVAGLDEVQGLQAQFGWTADSPDSALNGTNFGLTYVMGAYLGTQVVSIVEHDTPTAYHFLSAMTWNGICLTFCLQNLTESSYFTTQIGADSFVSYDYVNGNKEYRDPTLADGIVGTWLVRASQDNAGCEPGASVPCENNVPEPASIALVGLGLAGILARQRRKSKR